jgi:hypothetical protein
VSNDRTINEFERTWKEEVVDNLRSYTSSCLKRKIRKNLVRVNSIFRQRFESFPEKDCYSCLSGYVKSRFCMSFKLHPDIPDWSF